MLGNAAYLADVLHGTKVKNVRVKDFRNVKRVEPSSVSFSPEEMDFINEMDTDKLAPQDLEPYKPKLIPPACRARDKSHSH